MPSWKVANHLAGLTSHSRSSGQVRRLFISTAASPQSTTSPLSRRHLTFQHTRASSSPRLTATMPASLGHLALSKGQPLCVAKMFLHASFAQETAANVVLGTGGIAKLSRTSALAPSRPGGFCALLATAPYWQSPTAKTRPPAHTWAGRSPCPLKQTCKCVFVTIQPPLPGPREETVVKGMNAFLEATPCRTYVTSARPGRLTRSQKASLSGSYFTS
mmetsp:Transcript_141555/g.394522  ORF Transcript_141555/g.394522 Transcript_141555/m.394522 type:complete len:217 (+) Transcript_141555:176-826(+)